MIPLSRTLAGTNTATLRFYLSLSPSLAAHIDLSISPFSPLSTFANKHPLLLHCRDLNLTYLPAFKACTQAGGAGSVMCSYNELNGAPSCANAHLLQDVLRKEWGFEGFVASDCGAVDTVTWPHAYAK